MRERRNKNMSKLKNVGKAIDDKVNKEANRMEAKTGVPKEIWIGAVIIIVIIVLVKIF